MQPNRVKPLLRVVWWVEARSNAGSKGWWMACVWPKQPLWMTKYSPCHKVNIKYSHRILSNDGITCSQWKWAVKWSPFNEQNRGKYHSKKVELGRFSAWKHSCIFIIWFYRGSIWAFSNSHRPQWKMIKRSSLGVWKQSCSELWSFGQPETHNAASVLWSEQHTTKY